jgi:transcriptional regulator with XRE-family HTH domain
MEEIGQILAALRKENNLAQKELAGHLNLSIGTISNYENNVHSPDLNTLCLLADFYKVTTDYLLGRTKYRYDPQTLNRLVLKEYTVLDVLNTVLACEKTGNIRNLLQYARYLGSEENAFHDSE